MRNPGKKLPAKYGGFRFPFQIVTTLKMSQDQLHNRLAVTAIMISLPKLI